MAISNEERKRRTLARVKAWYAIPENREKRLVYLREYHKKHHKPKGLSRGEHRYNWKGDEATYASIHGWVKRYLGTPQECERCGRSGPGKYEWANIDHEYRRVLSDWLRLCTRCHRWHDQDNGLLDVPRTCGRCGVPHHESTPGCKTCQSRHYHYRRQGRTVTASIDARHN